MAWRGGKLYPPYLAMGTEGSSVHCGLPVTKAATKVGTLEFSVSPSVGSDPWLSSSPYLPAGLAQQPSHVGLVWKLRTGYDLSGQRRGRFLQNVCT